MKKSIVDKLQFIRRKVVFCFQDNDYYCKPTIIRDDLSRNLPTMNWFVATNFHNQASSTPISLLQLLAKYCSARNIRDNLLHANTCWFYTVSFYLVKNLFPI